MTKKSGRPPKNTVDYFPHHVKEDKTVKILEYKFGAKGYAGYYKLLELIGDTELHRPGFKKSEDKYYALHRTGLDEDEFVEMIDLLIGIGKVNDELWKSEKVIWIDDFVTSLSPVYFNRRKPLPTKEGIVSTSRNSQESKVKESKVEESEAKDMTPTPQFDLNKYSKKYPTLDVTLSFEKFKLYCKEKHRPLSDTGFNLWVRGDINSGWNQKAVSDVDKTNEFVTMYCVDGHGTKKVDENKTWNSFCDECEKQMVSENEMRHIRGKQLEKQNKQS